MRWTSHKLRAPLVELVVDVADAVTTETAGNVVVGLEDAVFVAVAFEDMPTLPEGEAVGGTPEGDVNGMTAVDSEEMSEERAERKDGAAVVSNESVLNGIPLVLWERPQKSIVGMSGRRSGNVIRLCHSRWYAGGGENVGCGRGVDVTHDEGGQRCEAGEFHGHWHSKRV